MNKVEMVIQSKKENIMVARSLVTAFMLTLDSNVSDVNEIKTIVSEGVTNAIVHGYNSGKENMVRVSLEYKMGRVYIEIEDTGIGIDDIDQAKEALYTSKPEEERSGLGFTIIEMFCDHYDIVSTVGKGTLLKCVKSINDFSREIA